MNLCKVLFLFVIGLLCINARCVKRQKKCQRVSTPCGCPGFPFEISCGCQSILEPTYGGFGSCNCQNIFLDELANCGCGCKYIDNYGVLNPEVSNYGRVPAIKLPKVLANFDARAPVPAINLPGLYDLYDLPSCQAIPPYVADLPCCQCQASSYQFIDNPCGCRTAIMEYLSPVEVPSPLLKVPYAEPCYIQAPKCQPQVIQLPSCGCQNMPFGCHNVNAPCSCDNGIKVSYGTPCGCQKNCGCQYGPLQLPGLDVPCACQACPPSPFELPVFGCGCQSLPPPVVGCGGKYLRQVTLQPPFL